MTKFEPGDITHAIRRVPVSSDIKALGDAYEALFNPRGIAIVGASARLDRIGGQPIKALQEAGYKGEIFPVNPKYKEIAGLRCYESIAEIEGHCDVAILAIPADSIVKAVCECGEKNIRFAIVFSGGFGETGASGIQLQNRLLQQAHESGVRIVGPNCQGLVSPDNGIFATFGAIAQETDMPTGKVSMVFQSGGFGFSIAILCGEMGVGFRHLLSSGNEIDVDTTELLSAFVADERTEIAAAYIEGVRNGRNLAQLGQIAASCGKPIFLWKGGKTAQGAKAAASHTAALSGEYDVFSAALRQFGVMEVSNVEELVDCFNAFSGRARAGGPNVGALGISGGAGIVFSDEAIRWGLALPPFSEQTQRSLEKIIPKFGSAANPADVTAGIFNDPSVFTEALEVVIKDPNIDQLCLLLASLSGELVEPICNSVCEISRRVDKPVLVAWSGRRMKIKKGYDLLRAGGIPVFSTPQRAARAAAFLAEYSAIRKRLAGSPAHPKDAGSQSVSAEVTNLLEDLSHAAGPLSETETKLLLSKSGIPVSRDVFVDIRATYPPDVQDLKFPVAVKVVSPDIPHKTDVGGVRLNVEDAASLPNVINTMIADVRSHVPLARLDGVIVSEMVRGGVETLVGVTHDPAFGPIVTFGLGGIFAEVLKDVSYRVAPFEPEEARAMIDEIRGRALLHGYRGQGPFDIDALVSVLVTVSRIAWEGRDQILEMDINPLIVKPAGAGVIAADALIVRR